MSIKIGENYIRTWALKIKAINILGGKCETCGNNNIFHLEFHHIIPSEKEYKINNISIFKFFKCI